MYGAAILVSHLGTPTWRQKLQSLDYTKNLITKDEIRYKFHLIDLAIQRICLRKLSKELEKEDDYIQIRMINKKVGR